MDPAARSLSVRLAADPASVPATRRFVVDGLKAWGRRDFADVAELVVSELAGNAALHGSAQFMHVTVTPREDGVRVAVEDDGVVPADAVSPSPTTLGADAWAATGRGLAIVSMLAAEWGVEATPRGKRIWADLTDPDAEYDVRPPTRAQAAGAAETEVQLPPGWVLVTLAQCPVELSIRQDQHLDELVRELQLAGGEGANPRSRALAAEIQDILVSPTHARLTGRRTAERARADGLEHVDIQMAMPPEFAVLVRRLHHAVTRADELCEENQLLSVASPPEIRLLRAWMTHEVVAQIERGEPPVPWEEWLRRTEEEAGRSDAATV